MLPGCRSTRKDFPTWPEALDYALTTARSSNLIFVRRDHGRWVVVYAFHAYTTGSD